MKGSSKMTSYAATETTTSMRSERSEPSGFIVHGNDKAYNHEESLDLFLLGMEKDPLRFEKMIDCYRLAMDKRQERRQRELELALKANARRSQVKQCSPVCVEL
mmetsp:Transcript_30604/g.49217  ORF Transcript_30604/g.49217 Transcript_30604/m.49217 type:complete len:104 (+) Transcript_30604:34-345(+)